MVARVVTALRSAEVRNSFSSFSLEEAIDQHIEAIEGETQEGLTRPNKLAQVDRVKTDFDNAIEGLRATDPDQFRQSDPNEDANTEVADEEDG